jgi:hypothetical protein
MPYTPNQIPLRQRIINSLLALFLIGYGLVGLIQDDIYIPGRRSRGWHLHGVPAIIMFVAMACAALVCVSVIVDHFDRRDNERQYKLFAHVFQIAGWVCFVAALVIAIVVK